LNESNLKAPTKKAFHFPKGETANAANEGSVTPVTPEAAKRARVATRKKATAVASSETFTTAVAASPAAPTKAAARKATVKKAAADKPTAEKAAVAKPASKKSSPKKSAVTKDAASAAAAPKTDATPVEKVKREKKEKVVRDSFTMPKSDYAKIAALKQKCLDAGVHVKKSELLRAGLALLEGVSEKRLAAVLADLETVKTGRPAND
jgi:hypothetical protein